MSSSPQIFVGPYAVCSSKEEISEDAIQGLFNRGLNSPTFSCDYFGEKSSNHVWLWEHNEDLTFGMVYDIVREDTAITPEKMADESRAFEESSEFAELRAIYPNIEVKWGVLSWIN